MGKSKKSAIVDHPFWDRVSKNVVVPNKKYWKVLSKLHGKEKED